MDEAQGPHSTSVEAVRWMRHRDLIQHPWKAKSGIHLRCVFFNKDVLVGLDILARADGAAGPADLDCLNSGIAIYPKDGGEFAL